MGGATVQTVERAVKRMELSETQRAKVAVILKPFNDALAKWRAAHRKDFEKIEAELKAAENSGNRKKTIEAAEKLAKLVESAPKPVGVKEKLAEVLTAEQIKKLSGRASSTQSSTQRR
jgi:hypothetical protein